MLGAIPTYHNLWWWTGVDPGGYRALARIVKNSLKYSTVDNISTNNTDRGENSLNLHLIAHLNDEKHPKY